MQENTLFSLGARLGLCASLTREGCRLADVGTDHAYLPVWLARMGRIRSAVAGDVREGPLQTARQNIERYGVQELVAARLSDGLDAVSPEEADDVVIAGMGGELIARIISRAPWLRSADKRLILQPMTSAEDLRAFLSREGFAVLREEVVRGEGRLYSAMLVCFDPARAAENASDPLFVHRGLVRPGTPEAREFLLARAASLRKREGGLRCTGKTEEADALGKLCGLLEREAREGANCDDNCP